MRTYDQACFSAHMGFWLINEDWGARMLAAIQAGLMPVDKIAPVRADSEVGYDLEGSTAIIPLVGALSKGGDSFGGGSTTVARKAIRRAVNDDRVEEIAVYIDSPGGHVAGTLETAEDLRKAGETKRTLAHIQDLGTSAAYWIASQAHRISASPASMVGNIGVRGAVIDSSEAASAQGIKVHLLSTGPFKAIGVPGVPVSEDQIEHMQGLIDQTFELFTEAVSSGRSLSLSDLQEALTGKIFMPNEALSMGLIDVVGDFQDVINEEYGMTKQEKEEIAAITSAAIAQALAQAGVVTAQSEESEAKAETEETVVASTPKATPRYRKQEIPAAEVVEPEEEMIEDEIEEEEPETTPAAQSSVLSSASYRKAKEAGAKSARLEAIKVLKVCAVHELSMDDAIEAVEANKTAEALTAELYDNRAAESDEEEIDSTTPLPKTKVKREAMTGSTMSAAQAFKQRQERMRI